MIKSLLIGFAFGVLAMFVSLFTMGAGHGTNVPASVLLPWCMLLAYAGFNNAALLITSLAQFPLYAFLLCQNRIFAILIGILHIGAVVGALVRSAA